MQQKSPYLKANAHLFDNSYHRKVSFDRNDYFQDNYLRVRGDMAHSIISIGDSSIQSQNGPSTPKNLQQQTTSLVTLKPSKPQLNFFQPANFKANMRLDQLQTTEVVINTSYGLLQTVELDRAHTLMKPNIKNQQINLIDLNNSSFIHEQFSDTMKESISKGETDHFPSLKSRPPRVPETAALIDQTSQEQTQRDFISCTDLSQVNQTHLGKQQCDNIRNEKTVSPVSIRHSNHKQPMMYVARFSKQTQAKQKIKASKIEKQRLHQASLSHTERQYTLPQRQQLQLSRSGLSYEQLAAKLLAQESVEIIDASYNQIIQIPHLEISNHCHFLIEINLSHNAIKEIPEETFRSIQLLEMVNLAANELRKLPESLFSLQKLISLDVSTNKISLLQPKVSLLKSLKMLLVEGNPLQRLPNSIGYLSDLEQISCDIFFYLAAQPRESTRVKNGQDQHNITSDLPQQRQLLVKDQQDNRLAKLMQIMQASKKNHTAFLELAYAFYFQRPTQHQFFDFDSDREMEQMEELLSVNNFGFAGSLMHCLAANNHAHLIEETVKYLQAIFGSDLGGQKQLRFNSILRKAINAKNSFDQTPLEVTVTYQFEESAEEILSLLGHFIDIEFRQITDKPYVRPRKGSIELSSTTQNESFVASNDQSAFMKPGNQQSELIPFQPNPSRGNTLNQSLLQTFTKPANQNYQVVEGVYTQSFQDNNDKTLDEADDQTYGVHPCIEIDQNPHAKMHPLVVSLANANFGVSYRLLETMHMTFQRKFANYQQLNKIEGNLFSTSLYRHCYDLNCVDQDGLSFLHHLFANFSRQHEKATKVFKLMLNQTQQVKNSSLLPARFTISSPHEIQDAQKEFPPPYKSLLLNQVTNFGETPFALAIEHQQNSAVEFAVNFNIQQIQNYLAQLRSQTSDTHNINEPTSFWNTPQAKLARNKKLRIQLDILRSPSPKSLQREQCIFKHVFDLTETKNMREITPIHRAVIKSNYSAVNSMLQSTITIRRILKERIETTFESKTLYNCVPRSILDQILVDVFKIDNSGKTPREYALKMVFMSKILRQAETNQIWSAISLQSPNNQIDPLLKPEAYYEYSLMRAVNNPRQIKQQIRYGHHLSRLFTATNRKGSFNIIEIRAGQKGDDSAITSRTAYDSEQRACSKGVKKAKSMAFNTIQYRIEQSQLTSASQLMLSQRMRVPSQVSKPNQPPDDNDFPSSQKKNALQIDTNNEAVLHFSKFAPQFEFKLASAQNMQQLRRFESPVQNELKAMAPFQLNNSNSSNSQTYRLMNLATAKGGLPTIQRIALNAAEEKDFSIMAQSAIKKQRKQLAKAEAEAKNNDIMCIEELDDSRYHAKTGLIRQKLSKSRKNQIEETIEGFNVGDSSCDEDFTALPSIQNEYTLQIKSFYQYKKPYIQQLRSNQFEQDFYTILGEINPCANKSGAYGIQTDHLNQPAQKSEQSAFTKLECLYSIVQRATNSFKLQDAKDVFDFLHYEIENQVQNPCKLTAATGLSALNSNSGFKALDLTSSRNSNLNFLKGEVKHLRAQLDLLTKHMISVPCGAKVDIDCSDKESSNSNNELTPVETPNVNECSSSAHAYDEAEAEDESVIECQEIRIAVGRQAKQDTVDITDFEDCSEKIPFADGLILSSRKETHRAEALLRNTAQRSPGHVAIELKKTLQRLPSASQYIPQAVSRFQSKRKSDYGYQARPDVSRQSSVRASLNSAVVPNTTRASFAPGQNLESTAKANKLAFLLDSTAQKSFAQSQINGPKPVFENVETEEGTTIKNRPLASNGLLSFSIINKDFLKVNTQMNNGDKLSSATEHESCLNFKLNKEQTINEAVLEELPISVNKLPQIFSAITVLPNQLADRKSQSRSSRKIQINNQLDTPYLNQDQLEVNEILDSNNKDKATNNYAYSILIEASEANSNALGLVRRHAAASRMSERQQHANLGQKFTADETRMSMKTFPNPDIDGLMINAIEQNSETSPCMAQSSAKQLIILLGEDQSEMAIETNNYDSNYSSTRKIGPKKLHQTTVVMPAGFSLIKEKAMSKRESSIMHAESQVKQKQRKKPSKTIAAPPVMRKETETFTKHYKFDICKQQSEQLRNSAVLPPKNGNIKQTLSTLIAQKNKQTQSQKPHQDSSNQKIGQTNSRLSVVDTQSQKVIKITLGTIPTIETDKIKNQNDIASQSSGLFGPAKKQFTGMISQKTVNNPDQRRGVKSLKPRNTAPASKPTIKLQMPKHNAKNEPFYQNARSPMISGPMPSKISIGQKKEHHLPAYADIVRQKTIDLRRSVNDFSLDRRSDTDSNKSGAVMTINLNSFCPAKLTGQPKKKNSRALGTESVLFGTGANSSELAKNVSNKKV